jgi:hypothetical protein
MSDEVPLVKELAKLLREFLYGKPFLSDNVSKDDTSNILLSLRKRVPAQRLVIN